ncbi:GNA-3 g alpha subunit GNA-3 [Fusarium heterosporum]|uniref:GNA-3 g alpha subunit GNA-3 n=1 Tax=Fusarium heterosporum TaxID=42747 RepID=A0A8H5SMP4_FUSHE|nr:GNA-3 g alpha subunit GNA-3 [Fusarium heterosporum]
MADPLSIIGTAGAIANIVDVLTKTITTVCDMRQAWKIADLTVLTFETQLNLLKMALRQIQKWATSSGEQGPEIVTQVDSCVTCCRILIGKIDSEVTQLERTIAGNLNMASKISLLFKSNDMEQIRQMIDQQIQALTLLLSACTANAIEDQRRVLHQPNVIQAFQQMDKDTASLIVHRDSASIMTATSINSSKWSIHFAFDSDLFTTSVYGKWIRKLATNRKEERTQDRDSFHRSRSYNPDVKLSATRLPDILINDHTTSREDFSQSSAKVSERISNSSTPPRDISALEPHRNEFQGAGRGIEPSFKGCRIDVKLAVLGSKTRKRVLEEMKRVNGDQCYTEEQLSLFRPMILKFTVESAKFLADKLLYSLPMVELNLVRDSLEYILAHGKNSKYETVLTPELAVAVGKIIDHPSFKSWKDIANLRLPDNGGYFLHEINRISSKAFIPSNTDAVEFSTILPGCIESTLQLGSFDLHLVDPGSPIPSRKVLFMQLESMHAVVFVFDLGSYVESLPDGSNSMFETMLQFEALVVSQFLRNSSIIAFLTNFNKLEENLSKIPLRQCFADYTGGDEALKAADFILSKINKLNSALLPIYPHLMNGVFHPAMLCWIQKDIQDVLVSMSLKKLMLR